MPRFERVVLVDDSPIERVFHEIMVRRAGFSGELLVLEAAVDLLRFVETADLTVPTCIFMDVNMPAMDGFEAAERLDPMLRDHSVARLVMLTSSDALEDRERADMIDCVHAYLIKPLTLPALQAALA